MTKKLIREMLRFNHLTTEIDAAYHEASLKLGLSDSAMHILYTLCGNGGSCGLSNICSLSGIRKQTINSALRKLQDEKLVYMQALDGKKKSVHLTDSGKLLAERTVSRIIEIENEIYSSWTKEERDIYIELTQRYLDEFKEKTTEL